MKKKIVVFAFAASAIALHVRAQESTTFGLRAGVNFQNLTGKDVFDEDLDNKIKTGFNIGVNAEIPVATDFYLQPGVLFSTKGAKSKDDDDIKWNISYIEIPINFLYKPVLGSGKLLLGIGPYVAFGIGGKVSDANGNEKDIKFDGKVTSTEYLANPYYKRLDAGGNLLFGYELSSKISAQLNAQLGLVNISPDIDGTNNDKIKTKNTGFGVSIGYRF
jgi:hypothetical protein